MTSQPSPVAATDHTVRIRRDLRLAVREWAPAGRHRSVLAPFVLVHGLASNARLWDGVAAHLAAAGHRVIAVDQRGHGRSDAPTAGYDFATVTEDLRLLVQERAVDRPVLVGQSWGGNVVMDAATRWGDAVAGVAAIDGGTINLRARFPDWDDCAEHLTPPVFIGVSRLQMEQWLRRAHPDWPEVGIAGTMGNFVELPDGTVRSHLRRDHHMAILRSLWEHRPADLYRRVTAAVLLIPADTGDLDRTAETRGAVEAAAAALPRARVRWMAGDHDLHAHHPGGVAGLLRDAVADGFFS